MKKFVWLLVAVVLLGLVACAGSTAESGALAASAASGTKAVSTVALADAINTDFRDALTVEQQLALGTLALENTDLAVTNEQAAELLPLWQVVQTLGKTSNVADVEMAAVVKQLEEAMTSSQLAAIGKMQLTADRVTKIIDDGALQMGRRGGNGSTGDGQNGGTRRGFGGGFAGGGPGGDFPGGGAGGGFDPSIVQTRQAELAASGQDPATAFLTQGAPGMVIRLLQTKLGQEPAFGEGGGFMSAVFTAVSESTGLSMDDIRAQAAEGKTLAQVIADNGSDASAVRTAIKDALSGMTLPESQDVDALIDNLLDQPFGAPDKTQPAPQS